VGQAEVDLAVKDLDLEGLVDLDLVGDRGV
jgi:hypothetical protein